MQARLVQEFDQVRLDRFAQMFKSWSKVGRSLRLGLSEPRLLRTLQTVRLAAHDLVKNYISVHHATVYHQRLVLLVYQSQFELGDVVGVILLFLHQVLPRINLILQDLLFVWGWHQKVVRDETLLAKIRTHRLPRHLLGKVFVVHLRLSGHVHKSATHLVRNHNQMSFCLFDKAMEICVIKAIARLWSVHYSESHIAN